MLKFIDENDFLLVDKYKQNEDGSVSWVFKDGELTHSGCLFDGFTVKSVENDIDAWAILKELEKEKKITVEDFVEDAAATAINNRQVAYKSESDPLFMEAQYDGTEKSLKLWRDKVAEIKAKYPL